MNNWEKFAFDLTEMGCGFKTSKLQFSDWRAVAKSAIYEFANYCNHRKPTEA